MKIQGLAVLAIVIILPMAIILNSYSSNQIKTLDLQISYDFKLQNATYDAIKAFQMNMSNSTTSDLANSKMRDIKASIKTFYNSLSSHFDMPGYGEEVLKDYVPAIVYTLYDGYYIYSAYNNQLDVDGEDKDIFYPLAAYKDGETIYGLKPYIYYSCRYKPNANSDFVITYSLDSYVTIQGIIDGNTVNESGYLLTGVDKDAQGNYTYKGVKIVEENNKEGLQQKVYINKDNVGTDGKIYVNNNPNQYAGRLAIYPHKKINGVKYYKENEKVFTIMNDEKLYQSSVEADSITKNDNGIKYYEEAYIFKQKIGELGLGNLKTSDAVDSYGIKYYTMGKDNPYPIERYIFSELNNSSKNGPYIEDFNSNFNAHKTEVIKNSIEKNLMAAIANYNKVSTSDVNFAMPKLKDYEWEMLTQNISMITFLQGLSIGGKVYNGYSVVQNTINEDFVSENSIYILNNGKYYGVTSQEVLALDLSNSIGLLNTDFERRTALASANGIDEKHNIYYYPREDEASYNSVISLNDNSNLTISEYFNGVGNESTTSTKYQLAQIYYTAIGRERYSMYRVANKLEEVQEMLKGEIVDQPEEPIEPETPVEPEQPTQSEFVRGDVNQDGIVDTSDLTFIEYHINVSGSGSDSYIKEADVNNDGTVNWDDWSSLYSYIRNGTWL